MRHKHGYRKLGKVSSHRRMLLRNLSIALIANGKINTTLPKAKELRPYIEKLVTKAKNGDFNSHRDVFAKIQNKLSTKKLIVELAPRYKDRKGGYTRIIKTSLRRGDAAQMAIIEFV